MMYLSRFALVICSDGNVETMYCAALFGTMSVLIVLIDCIINKGPHLYSIRTMCSCENITADERIQNVSCIFG